MNTDKHICPICGSEYKYCDYCKQMLSVGITPWRAICDTLECYNIFMYIREIKAGRENVGIIEDLKSNLQFLKENNVKLRESVTNYLNTLDFLKEKKVENTDIKTDFSPVQLPYNTHKKKSKNNE